MFEMRKRVPAPLNHHGQPCVPCANPNCDRWVSTSVANPYCCGGIDPIHAGCKTAHEGIGEGGTYEIHEDGPLGHSDFCNDRAKERGTQYERPSP